MKREFTKYGICLLIICLFALLPHSETQATSSKAEVEFTPGEGPTGPVDPDDPEKEIEGPEVEGSLAIVSVSDFHFGSIPVRVAGELHNIETEKPNIQIVDLRGSGTGWTVKAKLSNFTSDDAESLQGAEILINNGHADSVSTSGNPFPLASVVLPAGGETPVPVIDANSGTGMGLWVIRWYPPSGENTYIQLRVPPGKATAGSHSATINWVLEDVPTED